MATKIKTPKQTAEEKIINLTLRAGKLFVTGDAAIANLIGVSRPTVLKLRTAGLPCRWTGKAFAYNLSEVEDFLKEYWTLEQSSRIVKH